MIPIYTPSGSFLRQIDPALLDTLGNRVNVIRNRRGHAKRAILRGVDDAYIRQHHGKRGQHYEQMLESGKCHALKNVIGSH